MKNLIAVICFFFALTLQAQSPLIDKIEPINQFPGGNIIITGTGFNSDASLMQVWFGSAKGDIVYSTTSLIEVTVPVGASSDNITVINKSNKTSGKSKEKFFPWYSGINFDPSKIGTSLEFSSNQNLYDICACDFNLDGKVDLAVTKFDGQSSVSIYRNQSTVNNMAFTLQNTISIPSPTADIICSDLNSDGYPDLVATKGGDGGDRNNVYYMPNIGGTINTYNQVVLPVGEVRTERVQAQDLNGDGKPELIVSNSINGGGVYVIKNTSGGAIQFGDYIVRGIEGVDSSTGLQIQDFDGDRRPDILVVVTAGSTREIRIFKNESTETNIQFSAAAPLSVSGLVTDIITGDFNSDGKVDVATSVGLTADKIVVYLNQSTDGTITFPSTGSEYGANEPWGLTASDVNGDGFLDIIAGNLNQTGFTVLVNDKTGKFNAEGVTGKYATRNFAVVDLNGDSKPDFASTSQASTTGPFYLEIRRNQNCFTPQILADPTQYLCNAQSIPMVSIPNAGANFIWKLDGLEVQNSASNEFLSTAVGNLTVDAVSESGTCNTTSNSIEFVASVGTVPGDPSAGNAGPVCIGGTIQLTSTAVVGATYSWTGPNGFTSDAQNPQITNAQLEHAGEYSVTISTGLCVSSESSTFAEVFSFPNFFIESEKGNGFCEGTTNNLSVKAVNGYSYAWKKDGQPFGGSSNVLPITQAGTYTVEITYTSLGCVNTDVAPIVVTTAQPPAGTAIASKSPACAGELIQFSVDGVSSGNILYNWKFSDGTTSTDVSPSKSFSTSGNITAGVELNFEGSDGCKSYTEVIVQITDAIIPTIDATANPMCPGTEETLSVAGSYTSYTWDDGTTSADRIITQPGDYTVVTLDANGCEQSTTLTVNSSPVPALEVTPLTQTISPGESVQLEAIGADAYLWEPNDGSLSAVDISNPVATPEKTTSYTVTGSLTGGCSLTLTVVIKIDGSIGIPLEVQPMKAFSPNSDGTADFWEVVGIENYTLDGVSLNVQIFDRKGIQVYDSEGAYENNWDGTFNGQYLPDGVYFFVITGPSGSQYIPLKGSILLKK